MKYFTSLSERDILDMLSINAAEGFSNRSATFETYYQGGTPSSVTPFNNVSYSFEGYLCIINGEVLKRSFIHDGGRLNIQTYVNNMTREHELCINGVKIGSGTADRFYTAVARLSQPLVNPICIGMKKYSRDRRGEDMNKERVFNVIDDIIFNRTDAITLVSNRERQYVYVSESSSLVDEYKDVATVIKNRSYAERVSCPLINSYVTTHLLPDLDRRVSVA